MRMHVKHVTRPYSVWALLSGVCVFLFPLALQKMDFRAVSGGLSVSVHKSSPAYAAFEDLNHEYSNPLEELKTEARQVLASGTTFKRALLPKRETQRVIALQGMTVRKQTRLNPQPFYIGGLSGSAPKVVANKPPQLSDTRGELLPLVERRKRLLEYHSSEDFSSPGLSEKAKELVQKELTQTYEPTERLLPTRAGSGVLVGRSTAYDNTQVANNDYNRRLRQRDQIRDQAATDEEEKEKEEASSIATFFPNEEGRRPFWLAGQIEMKEGIAFLGNETNLTLKRMVHGQVFEAGRIWVTEGKFEIRVQEATGRLVAELSTRNGRVIGRGELDLNNLSEFPRGDRMDGLKIPLHPTSDGTVVQLTSGYSSGAQKMPMAQAKVRIESYTDTLKTNNEGRVADQSLAPGSSFVVQAEHKNHWNTLAVGQSSTEQEVRLYSKSLVTALINLSLEGNERKEAERQAVVWGRLMLNGKPLEGAEVELAGNYVPIYFNEIYLPDRSLQRTTKNGLFSFLLVQPGVQAARVRYKGKVYPAQVFPTEEQTVSYIDLSLQEKVSAQVNIYDHFNPTLRLSAHVRVIGVEEAIPVQTGEYIEFPTAAQPFVVEADAGQDYELARVMVMGKPDLIDVPTFRREWLNALAARKGINFEPRRGIVVGFVEDQAFEVALSGYGDKEQMQVVFFDQQGQPIEGMRGVAGGGFAIFNVPLGMQTLLVQPQYSKEALSQIVVAEPAFVHVIKYNFSR